MKKVTGFFFQQPLDLTQRQAFEIEVNQDLYQGTDILACNADVLTEIAEKYQQLPQQLHSFFIIDEISEV